MKKLFIYLAIFHLLIVANLYGQRTVVLKGATMFDGVARHPIPDSYIVIENGIVTGAGSKKFVLIPPDAETIDVTGKFIIPGLTDANVQNPSEEDLRRMLAWGVTSVNGVFGSLTRAKHLAELSSLDSTAMPRVIPCSPVVGAEGGLTWKRLFPDDTASDITPKTAEEARQLVRDMKLRGASRIMILYDSLGWCRSEKSPFRRMSTDVLRALVDESAQQEMYSEVSCGASADASAAQDAGASALMNGVIDTLVSAPLAQGVTDKGEYFIPTFCRYRLLGEGEKFISQILSDSIFRRTIPDDAVRRYTDPSYLKGLRELYPDTMLINLHYHFLQENMMTVLKNYGDVILGTDIPIFPGIAIHKEMEFMVQAGLTPLQAIAVGTTLGGKFVNDKTIGTISLGNRADMVVLDADPTDNILNTRSVHTIIKGGVFFDHDALLNSAGKP
ncbi:MAG TPA: amidohydrolase family protein [Bacteroidota bacterium]|nr:amidohydrolase family protein [Bacteroidota bacterium]